MLNLFLVLVHLEIIIELCMCFLVELDTTACQLDIDTLRVVLFEVEVVASLMTHYFQLPTHLLH